MRLIFSFLAIISLYSCTDDETAVNFETEISGKWKLIESKISSGGPEMIIEAVKDGDEFLFRNDLSFTSTARNECNNGTYTYSKTNSLQHTELELNFECSTSSSTIRTVIYAVTFSSPDQMILTPLDPRCIEGCSFTYQKIISKTD